MSSKTKVKPSYYEPSEDVKDYIVDPALMAWATDRQKQYIDAVNKFKGYRKAARALGVCHQNLVTAVKAVKKKASAQGFAPEHNMVDVVPDPFLLKGVSTLRDRDGNVVMQWHKTQMNQHLHLELMQEVIKEQCASLPKLKPVKVSAKKLDPDLMNVYTMTDCHMGMLAWGKETGADWDIKISEEILSKSFKGMLDSSPDAKSCVVAQLGDWLHYDGMLSITPTSGHILDADTRFQRLVSTSIRTLRRLVSWALEKHEIVYVLMAEGNHDMASSVWLREMFIALYENEPRVQVIDEAKPYYAIQHGETMLGWHHGHLKRPDGTPLLFAAEFSEIWGKTKYRYIHMGDKHHLQTKEHSGCYVIQHPTLAARDAYAARGGWHAMRGARAITYHKKYGEIFSNIVTPEMIIALPDQ